jgi:hypothetical protein
MIDWLNEQQLVRHLSGESMHGELVKRANEIFRFLAKNECLTLEHIDLLWNASQVATARAR